MCTLLTYMGQLDLDRGVKPLRRLVGRFDNIGNMLTLSSRRPLNPCRAKLNPCRAKPMILVPLPVQHGIYMYLCLVNAKYFGVLNAIFNQMSPYPSPQVTPIIFSKCVSILLYGFEPLSLTKAQYSNSVII